MRRIINAINLSFEILVLTVNMLVSAVIWDYWFLDSNIFLKCLSYCAFSIKRAGYNDTHTVSNPHIL